MKKIFLAIGTSAIAIVPVATSVACSSNKEDKTAKANVSLDFSSKAKSAMAIKSIWDDFYKDESVKNENNGVDLTISGAKGTNLSIDLSNDEWKQIVHAGEYTSIVNAMSFDEFIDVMKSATGATHQYSYAKGDALKLGVDHGGILHTKDESDLNFQKQWFTNNLIKELPAGIEITSFDPHITTNNILVTFTETSTGKSDKVDFHLKDAKDQEAADADNAGGANKFVAVMQKVQKPFKDIFGSIKKLFTIGKDKVDTQDLKDLASGVISELATGFIAKAAELIPPVNVILHIPVVGNKIEGLVNDHLILPVTSKIINEIFS